MTILSCVTSTRLGLGGGSGLATLGGGGGAGGSPLMTSALLSEKAMLPPQPAPQEHSAATRLAKPQAPSATVMSRSNMRSP